MQHMQEHPGSAAAHTHALRRVAASRLSSPGKPSHPRLSCTQSTCVAAAASPAAVLLSCSAGESCSGPCHSSTHSFIHALDRQTPTDRAPMARAITAARRTSRHCTRAGACCSAGRGPDVRHYCPRVTWSFRFSNKSRNPCTGYSFTGHVILGVLHLCTGQMLRTDVIPFLCLFAANFLLQGLAMYIAFPSYYSKQCISRVCSLVQSFRDLPSSIQSLLELAFLDSESGE